MNQRHLQNKSYVNVDVNLMVENVSRHKNGKRISASLSVQNQ